LAGRNPNSYTNVKVVIDAIHGEDDFRTEFDEALSGMPGDYLQRLTVKDFLDEIQGLVANTINFDYSQV
jgi:hypothetical protein